MGSVIMIPRIIKRKSKVVPILNPRDELREIIDEYLGMDVANLFDQVIEEIEYDLTPDEIGDDYEAISDGYRNMLVDTMNELQEIVYAKRIDRKRLERLWQNLNKNL